MRNGGHGVKTENDLSYGNMNLEALAKELVAKKITKEQYRELSDKWIAKTYPIENSQVVKN